MTLPSIQPGPAPISTAAGSMHRLNGLRWQCLSTMRAERS